MPPAPRSRQPWVRPDRKPASGRETEGGISFPPTKPHASRCLECGCPQSQSWRRRSKVTVPSSTEKPVLAGLSQQWPCLPGHQLAGCVDRQGVSWGFYQDRESRALRTYKYPSGRTPARVGRGRRCKRRPHTETAPSHSRAHVIPSRSWGGTCHPPGWREPAGMRVTIHGR